MRTYDFSPFWRSSIGFDRLFDLAEMAQRAGEDNYPPYNIERLADDRYQISLAVLVFHLMTFRSRPNRTWSRLKAARPRRPRAISSIAGFRLAASIGSSALRTTCR